MSGLTYGPKPIVDNGLVLHLDPANPISIASSQRVDPIDWVTDMKKSSRVSYATSHVSDTVQDYTPAWENNNGGTMRFETSSTDASDDYGYIDLETPVVGIHSFSINDCYTFDFWWKQDTVTNDDSNSYISGGGQIYGPRNRSIIDISTYNGYKNRHYRYPMTIRISHPHGEENSEIAYSIIFLAKDEKYTNLDREHLFEYFLRSPKLDFNTWNHLCGVFDLGDSLGNGKKAYLYLNGELGSVTGVTSITGSDPFSFDQNGNSYIGASSFDYTPNVAGLRGSGAKGVMGPFKIYNRALTQTEVRQNYESLRHRYDLLPVGSTTVASGQKVWTSDDTWIVPDGVTSISAVCVGGGGGASIGGGGWSGAGGGGGGLSYGNAISVVPRQTLTITVGDGGEGDLSGEAGGDSSIFSEAGNTTVLMAEGGVGGGYRSAGGQGGEGNLGDFADGGGDGGDGGTATQNANFQDAQGGGGGGAGGYSGAGGNGGYGLYNGSPGEYLISPTNGSSGATSSGAAGGGGPSGGDGEGGGGVGIIEKGDTGGSASRNSDGESGSSGTEGTGAGGNYGGGGGGRQSTGTANDGASGAVRIIWGDYFTDSRSYPSNSADA